MSNTIVYPHLVASFAERIGLREVRSVIQTSDLDDETRVQLWNIVNAVRKALYDSQRETLHATWYSDVVRAIWAWELKKPSDEQPASGQVWDEVKDRILKGPWYDALDIIEAIVGYVDRFHKKTHGNAAVNAFNNCFEKYLVGFRFIGREIAPIDTTAAAEALIQAVSDAASVRGAQHHLERAIELLASRANPDYPNSIKESISAVEAVCVAATSAKTLGAALKKLEAAGATIHPALEAAWLKMYGWTSDETGVRHGSIEVPTADQALAKYMLVTCSAFVSYVIELCERSNIDLSK